MDNPLSLPQESFWFERYFQFVKPHEFKDLGIDKTDVPLGTFVALKHPPHLQSRFSGNAYGLGLLEGCYRLDPADIEMLQAVPLDDHGYIKTHYKELNKIYRKLGLLVRFSRYGKSYYLIPDHLVSNSLINVKAKLDEISKAITQHRKQYLKEYHLIGVLTNPDDLITTELPLLFKEHRFVILDSLKSIKEQNVPLDMVILTRDIYDIVFLDNFNKIQGASLSKNELDEHATCILWRIFDSLKQDGELLILGDYNPERTNKTTKVFFKTEREVKNFLMFSHIFKTRKKYKTRDKTLEINIFDFQKYLTGMYVDQEVVDQVLGARRLEDLSFKETDRLPYINLPLRRPTIQSKQEKTWGKLLSRFFETEYLGPLIPETVKDDWDKRFSCSGYSPQYMMSYLGKRKHVKTARLELMSEVVDSGLIGCPPSLIADYRDSFEYVSRTLRVIKRIKEDTFAGDNRPIINRVRQSLDSRGKKPGAFSHILRLLDMIKSFEKIGRILGRDDSSFGERTGILDDLEILGFFGFSLDDLKEIILIVLGHTTMGRIISGKMNEMTLKPVLDLAASYEPRKAVNLLRYCLLMTLAESEAARGSQLGHEQLSELTGLYESMVRVATSKDLDWDRLQDEKAAAPGGIHNKIIPKLLKMMGCFEFINYWAELGSKGGMEKEALAGYDKKKTARIENVLNLIGIVKRFEDIYLKSDPLKLSAFYRKFLNIEFHGTGHLFERMESRLTFILLWISVNVTKGEIINFNPILGDVVSPEETDHLIRRVELEAEAINIRYLDHSILGDLSEQLYGHSSAYIVGTGFKFRVDPETRGVEIAFMDIDKGISEMDTLSKKLSGMSLAGVSNKDMIKFETLFSNLESFYQSHLKLLEMNTEYRFKLPERQKRWFEKVSGIRQYLNSHFRDIIFKSDEIFTDLEMLRRDAPSFLGFILPELVSLKELTISHHLYMTYPVMDYILTTTHKLQALVVGDQDKFQDVKYLHHLAKKEFGPMTAGTIGLNESQIDLIEEIVVQLRKNRPLFTSLVKSFVFQDIGRVPYLRDKYSEEITGVDLGLDGSLFIEKEGIAERYNLSDKEKHYLIFLVKHHAYLYHILKGELAISALEDLLAEKDKDLFDAFFVFSMIMLSSIRRDMILEDLADFLFRIRERCHEIIDEKSSLKDNVDDLMARRGAYFFALQAFEKNGLPGNVPRSDYIKLKRWQDIDRSQRISAGEMILGMESVFRLRGIRNIRFIDLVNLVIKVPLRHIYRQRNFSSVGYAGFEKEVFEAFRIYKTLQNLNEDTRHFILGYLVHDRIRIYGYEKVSSYLNYWNQIKLLLIGLLAAGELSSGHGPARLNYLDISEKIEARYEAVNQSLNELPIIDIWEDKKFIKKLTRAKSGIVVKNPAFPDLFSIDFIDRLDINRKLAHLESINDVGHLKKFYVKTLKKLQEYPFYTDDYRIRLKKALKDRTRHINDKFIARSRELMEKIDDIAALEDLMKSHRDHASKVDFSADQRHRLEDLYELKKDRIKGAKLEEIEQKLEDISKIHEVHDYWHDTKTYLKENSRFLGKDFEILIARKFDEKAYMLRQGKS